MSLGCSEVCLSVIIYDSSPVVICLASYFINLVHPVINFHCFGTFLLENNIILYGNWAGIRSGTSRIFLNIILVSKQPSKVQFRISNLNFQFLNPFKILLFLITPCFHPKFSNPYCRKGSYGPYGPLWFSAKHYFDP